MFRKAKDNKLAISHKSRLQNKYLFLQVSAYYITHHDVVAGLVSLAKELKIKRIIIGSRSEFDVLNL